MSNNNSKNFKSVLKRKSYAANTMEGSQQYEVHPKYLSKLRDLDLYQVLEEKDIEEIELISGKLKKLTLREGVDSLETMKKFLKIDFKVLKNFYINRWQFPDWSVLNERPNLIKLDTHVVYQGILEVQSKYLEELSLFLTESHPIADFHKCSSLKELSISIFKGVDNSTFPNAIVLPSTLENLCLFNDSQNTLPLSKLAFPDGTSNLKCLVLNCDLDFSKGSPVFENVEYVAIKSKYLDQLPNITPNAETIRIIGNENFQESNPLKPMMRIKKIEGYLQNNPLPCTIYPNAEEIYLSHTDAVDMVKLFEGFSKLKQLHVAHIKSDDQMEVLHKKISGVKITAAMSKHIGPYTEEISEFEDGLWKSHIYISR